MSGCRDAVPILDVPEFPSYNFEDKFLLHDKEACRSKTSRQTEESVSYNSAFLLNTFLCSIIWPVLIGFNLQDGDAKFFEFPKSADDGSLGAGGPSKTCPDVPNEFRVSGCKQESRLIIPLGLGILMGLLGTWDNPELLAVSGSWNSLCLAIPESEP